MDEIGIASLAGGAYYLQHGRSPGTMSNGLRLFDHVPRSIAEQNVKLRYIECCDQLLREAQLSVEGAARRFDLHTISNMDHLCRGTSCTLVRDSVPYGTKPSRVRTRPDYIPSDDCTYSYPFTTLRPN